MKHNVDNQEVEKFSALADKWWAPNGPFRPLHKINPYRIKYIIEQVHLCFEDDLENKDLIDIGCGGGLISEPMCRLGAKVTAIDASAKNIMTAKYHAEQLNLNVNYQHTEIEYIISQQQKFEIILALEIIEHVPNYKLFIDNLVQLMADKSIIILTTINRTIASYLQAIIGAEYLLRWLPIGTHSWKKFIKPSEITEYLSSNYNELQIQDLSGLTLNPLKFEWQVNKNLDVNYMMAIVKK
jgi:2-polyprenyl-6-hydroxyphenyl methylase/3-demethylubiquinone-9 3-methyltransferase